MTKNNLPDLKKRGVALFENGKARLLNCQPLIRLDKRY